MGYRLQLKLLTFASQRLCIALATAVTLTVSLPVRSIAQQPPPRRGTNLAPNSELPVTLVVSVRETSGMPLPGNAFVKLSSNFSGLHLTAPTQDGSAATFPNIQSGEYDVEVSSAGYKTATEHASVLTAGGNYQVFVYMHSDKEVSTGNTAPGRHAGCQPTLAIGNR